MASSTQSKTWSFIESLTNTLSSFVLSVWIQWMIFPYFGIDVSLATNVAIVLIFMGVSLVRGYFIRRFFNWLAHR